VTLYALVIKAALKVKVASFHAVHGVMSRRPVSWDVFHWHVMGVTWQVVYKLSLYLDANGWFFKNYTYGV
jgi:hypothetical protein